MTRPRPISLNIIPDEELETSNTAAIVRNAYATAMAVTHDEGKAFDAAVRAWRSRTPIASLTAGQRAVADIIGNKL
jgi:hypothetical protein